MKKSKVSAAVALDAVTPAQIAQIENVLASAAKNKFQASAVYAAHNSIFGLKETPEVCASCNIKRVAALRKYYAEYKMHQIDSTNAAANEEGQALTNVPRETLGDLDGIFKEYGAPAFDSDEERTSWLNGLLTQNSLALVGFRQLDAKELDMVNAALVSEVPAREEATDLQGIYDIYAPTIVGAETETAEEKEGEIADTTKPGVMDEGPEMLDLKNKKGEYFQGVFNSEDGVNGALVDAQGITFKPGTYSTDTGDSYAVQPGGKATYKNDAI